MSLFTLRKRVPSQAVSGANTRIRMGTFGVGGPAYAFADVDPTASSALYHYHEGDLFTPGAGNFVFEPNFELPLQTIWGRGFIRNPNTFNVYQPPQVWSPAHVKTNGLGGLIAGQVALQPLLEMEGESEV